MPSEGDFFAGLKSLIEKHDRAKRLFADGKMSEERYAKHRAEVTCRLPQLKEENLKILSAKLSELEGKLAHLKDIRSSGKVEEREYQSLRHGFEAFKANLESDRSIVELCSGDELIDCLRLQCDAKQYENYWVRQDGRPLMARDGDLDDYAVSEWVKVSAILLVLASLIFGAMTQDELAVVLSPTAVLACMAVGTLLMHEATVLLRFKNASTSRAFSCVITQLVFAVLLGAFLLALIVFTMQSAKNPQTLLGLVESYTALGGALMAVLAAASVIVVKFGYDVPPSSAAAPAMVGYIVCLIAATSMYLALLA